MKVFTWLCCGCLLLALLPVSASEPSFLMGSVVVRGSGFLNGRLISAHAVSLGSGDRLTTGAHSGAIITISDGDVLAVGENSGIILVSRPDGVAAELDRGGVLVTTNQKRLRELRLPEESVEVRTPPGAPSRYQISRLSGATYILPGKGSVSIYSDGRKDSTEVALGMVGVVRREGTELVAKQRATVPPQHPSSAAAGAEGQRAGQISVTIPTDYIVRGPAQMQGLTGAAVLLNDLLRTGPRGRMRVAIDDGSILTVGSNSQLQVREHNTQAQQTSMEMLYGRMRAQVVKRTAPNGKFEIRTSTAICGVLGTDFYVEATRTSTRVVVFQGAVRVIPLGAGLFAGTTIGAGQMGVSTASSVSSPVAASGAQIQTAVTATEATQQAAQAGATGLAGSASAASRVTVVAATIAPPAAAAAVSVPAFTTTSSSPSRP